MLNYLEAFPFRRRETSFKHSSISLSIFSSDAPIEESDLLTQLSHLSNEETLPGALAKYAHWLILCSLAIRAKVIVDKNVTATIILFTFVTLNNLFVKLYQKYRDLYLFFNIYIHSEKNIKQSVVI